MDTSMPDDLTMPGDKHIFGLTDRPDPFARLPALAERLGVKEGDGIGEFDLITKDGKKYAFFKLIEAVLDRMDKVLDHE